MTLPRATRTRAAAATAAPDAPGRRSDVTRALLLDTAERLFAEQGYDGTGVRQIADQAGVNLGAIHYYWGSKEALCRDALERRLVPVLAERTARIEAVAREGAGLAALLDASHRPSLLAGGAGDADAEKFRGFYGRMLFDPSPEVRAILASLLDPFAQRFVALLRALCPDLDDNEFYWRVTFLYGAFLYAHTMHTRTTALWGDRFDRTDFAAATDFLTRFLEGGLRAAPVQAKRTKRAARPTPASPKPGKARKPAR